MSVETSGTIMMVMKFLMSKLMKLTDTMDMSQILVFKDNLRTVSKFQMNTLMILIFTGRCKLLYRHLVMKALRMEDLHQVFKIMTPQKYL
jgi:hypothetical protein